MCRLDGTVTKKEERQKIINTFTNDRRFTSFLLTTQVHSVTHTVALLSRELAPCYSGTQRHTYRCTAVS